MDESRDVADGKGGNCQKGAPEKEHIKTIILEERPLPNLNSHGSTQTKYAPAWSSREIEGSISLITTNHETITKRESRGGV